MNKEIQIEGHSMLPGCEDNNEILRATGIKRIHRGKWYAVNYNGVLLAADTAQGTKCIGPYPDDSLHFRSKA